MIETMISDEKQAATVGLPTSEVCDAQAVAMLVLNYVQQYLESHRWPDATYRIQFNRDFNFRDAKECVQYWHHLGITDCYTSPYFRANAGSRHGYDIVSHSELNPELGSEGDFQAFTSELQKYGMRHILDFVPNHMGIGGNENSWFQDVLENGPSSHFSTYFDIDWQPLKTDLEFKVLLPVLGSQYGNALENQELKLEFSDGAFHLHYYNRSFPIAPRSYEMILRHRIDALAANPDISKSHLDEFQSILTAITHLPYRHEIALEKREERAREKEVIKKRLQRLSDDSPEIRKCISENIRCFNGRRGEPASFQLLDKLLQDQAYRLCLWRVAADEINYRRFFDVNELAAICMEKPEVFEATHRLTLQLLDAGQVSGLRIDHADGLFDPTAYLWHLQSRRFLQLCRHEFESRFTPQIEFSWSDIEPILEEQFGELRQECPESPLLRSLYLLVEKILGPAEKLPDDWPVHGTTGYEFLNSVNGLFVDGRRARELDAVYAKFIDERQDFRELVYEAKRLILKVSMSSELHVLGHQLDRISERNWRTRDFTRHGLIQALREVIACFPVYRTYTIARNVLDRDHQYIEHAIQDAKTRNPAVSNETFDFIRSVVLHDAPAETSEEEWALRIQFVGRFQQFTGPMMAKAVEDTAFYRFHRLISLNEVGSHPEQFGTSVERFHEDNLERQRWYAHGMLTTSTHDTKRSEDVRARINLLSECPSEWKTAVLRWSRLNRKYKTMLEGKLAPSRNDEYLLYQTLIGAWPMQGPYEEELSEFVRRIQEYMLKAVREAKQFSSWIAPNEDYERALAQFVNSILAQAPTSQFHREFESFVQKLIPFGMWNSLSQTLLKLTSPGMPDIYQGTELWDLSLVDPDNRRAVDYATRQRLLESLRVPMSTEPAGTALTEELTRCARDGRIKLFTIARALRARKQHPELFQRGRYVPLQVVGREREHVCAFARVLNDSWSLTIAPRLIMTLCGQEDILPIGGKIWGDTRVMLPSELSASRICNQFTNSYVACNGTENSLMVADTLGTFPVGLLFNE